MIMSEITNYAEAPDCSTCSGFKIGHLCDMCGPAYLWGFYLRIKESEEAENE